VAVDLLSLKQVLARTGLSRPTLYRLRERGEFPRPVKVFDNPRFVCWVSSDVESWCEQRRPPAVHRG